MVYLLLVVVACSGGPGVDDTGGHTGGHTDATGDPSDTDPGDHTDPGDDTDDRTTQTVAVTVTLDGAPVAGATVLQAGTTTHYVTDAAGVAIVEVDRTLHGERYVVAGVPDARQAGGYVTDATAAMTIALTRYGPDNERYLFQDPGQPGVEGDTSQCAHCHKSLVADWWGSPHRTSASNPKLWDLYEGEGGTLQTLNRCADARCADATNFGGCADCHAPGIDGALGGRDLRDASGISHDAGVHCDVCHRVDRVVLDAAPGVAGRLVLTRPSEPGRTGLGDWLPLTFGPLPDVPNVRMGSVERGHFRDGSLCGGCHELDAPAGDASRWPTGRFPVQTTYSEWKASPQGQAGVACPACHMPPDPLRGNGADLGNHLSLDPGYAAGWMRPPGDVRMHTWVGPRQRGSHMLELAAAVGIEKTVVDSEVTARVTVKNVGCGHALPTGEPMREVMLLVTAACDGAALTPTGGDVVPDLGGWLDRRTDGFDQWPGARVGDEVRVARFGDWLDYPAVPPFDAATAAAKGLRQLTWVGASRVVAVDGDTVRFDAPLPDGDVAWRAPVSASPADGDAMVARAGAPGFLFARVLADAAGEEGVPHFRAVDVLRDNRLPPQASWTTTHTFAATCADPVVTATLVHRAAPYAVQAARGWADVESVMARVTR
jgi:hypothetical protein